MYDKQLVLEILKQIQKAVQMIQEQFKPIKSVTNFTDSMNGMEKLNSICMLLIAIGEALKNLDKVTDKSLLTNYPQVDWKKAKAMRDIISHHYFEVDAEVIFDVCQTRIGEMEEVISQIIKDQV